MFNQPPAGREIGISRRQGLDHMHVIWQQYDSFNRKGTFRADSLNCLAQSPPHRRFGQ
jgi:hypothetical protein